MATLTIEGQDVQVSDKFLKLSPEEQHATVDAIASQMGVKPGGGGANAGLPDDINPDKLAGNPQYANDLRAGLQQKADEMVVGPASGKNQAAAAILNAGNTMTLNLPNRVAAAVESGLGKMGVPGFEPDFTKASEEYNQQQDAVSRQFPKTAAAGTVAGALAGAAVLPGIGGAATTTGRALQAGATAGGYSGLGELVRTGDAGEAAKAAGLGAVLGAGASPLIEKTLGLFVSKLKAAPFDATGTLTPEAAQAAKAAGLSDRDLSDPSVIASLKSGLEDRGVSVPAARQGMADEFGIGLTPGQATQDFATQQQEQGLLRGAGGQKAQEIVGAKLDPATGAQTAEIQNAARSLGERLGGAPVSPQGLESAIQTKAAQAKGAAQATYRDALGRQGAFEDGTFGNIGQSVRQRLSSGNEPIVIDKDLTPAASKALDELDAFGSGTAANKAAPDGTLPANTLQSVDQTRKKLVAWAQAAQKGSPDRRATSKVIEAFDQHLGEAMSNGLFNGDQQAVQLLKEARSKWAGYKGLFSPQGAGDDAGRMVERIVQGDRSANEIANAVLGTSQVGGSGLNVRLASRLEKIFGKDSEMMQGVKQSLWQKLTETAPGQNAYGPAALAKRIAEFADGKGSEVARFYFSPSELQAMKRFAQVVKMTEPQRGTYSTSGTPGGMQMVQKLGKASMHSLAPLVGLHLGGIPGAIAGALADAGTSVVKDSRNLKAAQAVLKGVNPTYLPGPGVNSRALGAGIGTLEPQTQR